MALKQKDRRKTRDWSPWTEVLSTAIGDRLSLTHQWATLHFQVLRLVIKPQEITCLPFKWLYLQITFHSSVDSGTKWDVPTSKQIPRSLRLPHQHSGFLETLYFRWLNVPQEKSPTLAPFYELSNKTCSFCQERTQFPILSPNCLVTQTHQGSLYPFPRYSPGQAIQLCVEISMCTYTNHECMYSPAAPPGSSSRTPLSTF